MTRSGHTRCSGSQAGLVLAYLVVPSLIVVVRSFSGGRFLEFSPRACSPGWHQAYWATARGSRPRLRSVKVATLVNVLATVIGTMASWRWSAGFAERRC